MSRQPGRHRLHWFCYMGRFAVPQWLFDRSPMWLHVLADKLGGME